MVTAAHRGLLRGLVCVVVSAASLFSGAELKGEPAVAHEIVLAGRPAMPVTDGERVRAAAWQENDRPVSGLVDVDAIAEPLPVRAARGALALLVLLSALWLFSTQRSAIRWSLVAKGLGLQLVFALLVLKTDWGRGFFRVVNNVFVALIGYTNAGASFVFGNLVQPVVPLEDGASVPLFANFAFSVLPTIIFFSALMTILYYRLGI